MPHGEVAPGGPSEVGGNIVTLDVLSVAHNAGAGGSCSVCSAGLFAFLPALVQWGAVLCYLVFPKGDITHEQRQDLLMLRCFLMQSVTWEQMCVFKARAVREPDR